VFYREQQAKQDAPGETAQAWRADSAKSWFIPAAFGFDSIGLCKLALVLSLFEWAMIRGDFDAESFRARRI